MVMLPDPKPVRTNLNGYCAAWETHRSEESNASETAVRTAIYEVKQADVVEVFSVRDVETLHKVSNSDDEELLFVHKEDLFRVKSFQGVVAVMGDDPDGAIAERVVDLGFTLEP